ncbi:MAG: phage/plasmid replication protein [Rikenellaceae bacterium]
MSAPSYDRVKFWVDAGAVSRRELASISDRLNLLLDKDRAYIGNICMMAHNGSISGCGSLTKFIHGENLHSITQDETEAVVNALSDAVGVDISNARVTQLEYGANFEMSHPIAEYLDLLGSAPYTKRMETAQGETLTYQTKSKRGNYSHVFYDKGAEMGVDGNILRYELRYRREIAKTLKRKGGITLQTLYDSRFCDEMKQRYYDFYNSIKKMNDVTINTETIKTVNDGFESLVAILLNEATPNRIEEHIADLKRQGVYSDPKYYTRLKSKLNAIAQRTGITTSTELITELSNEVHNACFIE